MEAEDPDIVPTRKRKAKERRELSRWEHIEAEGQQKGQQPSLTVLLRPSQPSQPSLPPRLLQPPPPTPLPLRLQRQQIPQSSPDPLTHPPRSSPPVSPIGPQKRRRFTEVLEEEIVDIDDIKDDVEEIDLTQGP